MKEVLEEAGINYVYFSASTMDPWVDFIGIPKERKDGDGSESYLELVRPRNFAEDKVEAIILDEFNRSHKKVRNAVMELIQFKSINGKKFNNLKVIWAAINPHDEDETYSVEKLDPAQFDRFQIKMYFDNMPDMQYFAGKYGVEWAEIAIDWFKKAIAHFNEMKKKNAAEALDIYEISPRTLDYALQVFKDGGEIRDTLPSIYNVGELQRELSQGSTASLLKKHFESGDTVQAKAFINKVNVIENAMPLLLKNEKYRDFFIPLVGSEDLVRFITKEDALLEYVIKPEVIATYKDVLETVEKSMNLSTGKIKKITLAMNNYRASQKVASGDTGVSMFTGTNKDNAEFEQYLNKVCSKDELQSIDVSTIDREKYFTTLTAKYPESFNNVEAEFKMLKVLFKIIEPSQIRTLTNDTYKAMVPLINTVTDRILSNGWTKDMLVKKINQKTPFENTRLSKVQQFLDSNVHQLKHNISYITFRV
jgi:hypothetical protein